MQRTYKKRGSGFTLIELLIVMVVLGILAAVVIFALGGLGEGKKAGFAAANDYLPKSQALREATEVAQAAAVIDAGKAGGSLGEALLVYPRTLTLTTEATSIFFAGKTSTNDYFTVWVQGGRNETLNPTPTCLVTSAGSSAYYIKYKQCKVPR